MCWGRGAAELSAGKQRLKSTCVQHPFEVYPHRGPRTSLSPDVVHDLVFTFTGNAGVRQENLRGNTTAAVSEDETTGVVLPTQHSR